MKNTVIKPIFVQTPNIWQDFSSIEINASDAPFYQKVNEFLSCHHNIILRHQTDWMKPLPYKIAFGAYFENEMIGFAKAFYTTQNIVHLDSLYIDSDYHGMGIGTRLLKRTEDAASVVTNKITLYPKNSARGFYKSLNYQDAPNNELAKELKNSGNKIIPIFQLDDVLKFSFDINVYEILPFGNCQKYAHINKKNEIDALAINTHGDDIEYWFDDKLKKWKIYQYKKLLNTPFIR